MLEFSSAVGKTLKDILFEVFKGALGYLIYISEFRRLSVSSIRELLQWQRYRIWINFALFGP